MSQRGLFVVLEGIDGAGTTTQCHRLVDRVRALGAAAHFTCEPSGGALGRMLRQFLREGADGHKLDPAAMALMFAADRMDHLATEVTPHLAKGCVVISDRYVLSSLAYQGAFLPVDWVAAINGQARAPDLTFLVEVDVAVATARRAARGGRPDQYEEDATQRAVRLNYAAYASRPGLGRMLRVDGAPGVDEVTAALWEVLEPEVRTGMRTGALAAAAP